MRSIEDAQTMATLRMERETLLREIHNLRHEVTETRYMLRKAIAILTNASLVGHWRGNTPLESLEADAEFQRFKTIRNF